ncbi:5-dehydro-2-deoxygluconokinase 1 [Rhynchospora pubera]|uniref:5-dehydro-2-deoxygluconokinase 1 n=1 Tax=Rhynchospora pubera TaxID=906938 RepID=A0AAV8DHR5_9POAL|nr:5-dehydro-2-deoxygluconokinase 1 [Rhynchospora pubera]
MSLVKTLINLPFTNPNPSSSHGTPLQLPPPRRAALLRPIAGLRLSGVGATLNGNYEVSKKSVLHKGADLATLGNLCVDIVLNVPCLPPANRDERKEYMENLASSPPDKKFWEAGGNCNLVIAASRLGLKCVTLGHVGHEIYGNFLLEVLHEEHIDTVGMMDGNDLAACSDAYETLLCWVLVDPFQRHGFCSRADFSQEPAFNWIKKLPEKIRNTIQESKILFCNGYAFDELHPHIIISSIECAISSGTAVFFDPGPRGKTLFHGTPDERRALDLSLRQSDVLLLTSDEVESLTGIQNPIKAGQELLKSSSRTKWVVIKMGSKGSLLITKSMVTSAPAFKVELVDTVGCGDSFTAAIAFGFLHNLPAAQTLMLANAVGAATATGCGAGRNVAHLEVVLDLLKQSKINEDYAFWAQLLKESEAPCTISLVSGLDVYGCADGFSCIPVRSVVEELLPMFEAAYEKSTIRS